MMMMMMMMMWLPLGAAVSLAATSLVFIKIMRRRTSLLWLALTPLRCACVQARINQLEVDFWLPERLAMATCFSYWILSASMLGFHLHCRPIFGHLAVWAATAAIFLHGIVGPRVNYLVIVRRAHLARATSVLTRWLVASFGLPTAALISYAPANQRKCADFVRLAYDFRYLASAAMLGAFAHMLYVETGLDRAFDTKLTTLPRFRRRSLGWFDSHHQHSMRRGLPSRHLASIMLRHRVTKALFWGQWTTIGVSAALGYWARDVPEARNLAVALNAAVCSSLGTFYALVALADDKQLRRCCCCWCFGGGGGTTPNNNDCQVFKLLFRRQSTEDDDDDEREFPPIEKKADRTAAATAESTTSLRVVATTFNCAEVPSVRALLVPKEEPEQQERRDVKRTDLPPGSDRAASSDTNDQLELAERLRAWLPPGRDVYAIGVQECACWDEIRVAVAKAMGEDQYVVVAKAAIGSRRVKGHIGIVVVARRELVRERRVADPDARNNTTPNGGSPNGGGGGVVGYAHVPVDNKLRPVARAVCAKGCAGVLLRLGDAQIAFLAAHLPADASGRARRDQRNACVALTLASAADQLLRGVADARAADAGAHLAAATHTFFLGDLNYRAVDPDLDSTRLFDAIRASDWETALELDELRRERRAGRVFADFEEPRIAFPPTFRRKTGPPGRVVDPANARDAYVLYKASEIQPLLGDGANPDDNQDTTKIDDVLLAKALERARARLANEGPLDGAAIADAAARAAAAEGLRAPSWTDRILVHSIPAAKKSLRVVSYAASEAIVNSDHRPVVLEALLDTDESRARIFETARTTGRPTSDYCDLVVTVEIHDLKTVDPIARRDDDVVVALYFPIPVEDPFAARRQLRAAATAINQTPLQERTPFGHQRRRDFAATRAPLYPLDDAVVSRRADNVHPKIVRHALVALEAKNATSLLPVAFALLELPNTADALPARARFDRVPLAFRGQRRGTVSGRVHVKRVFRRTASSLTFTIPDLFKPGQNPRDLAPRLGETAALTRARRRASSNEGVTRESSSSSTHAWARNFRANPLPGPPPSCESS